MLKDFSKLNTFLTVAREKSFSKASAKIGISQPAVTQQIKFIEDYLQTKILERKKNGIILTKEGNELYKTALKLEKSISNAQKELMKIVDKDIAVQIGASYTIGNYILPSFHSKMKETLGNEIIITIDRSAELIQNLADKRIDIALIETPIMHDHVFYREWLDDEVIMFSNVPLPKTVKPIDMQKYSWVVREAESHTRKIAMDALEHVGIDCSTFFDIQNVLTDSTAIKQTVLKADKESDKPTASVVSKFVIEDEIKAKILFDTKIKGLNLGRKLYIAYLKENKHDAHISNVVSFLMKQKVTV
jgi:DNA-binding transcriptional LysR family regulator